jgi:hypothetical protein
MKAFLLATSIAMTLTASCTSIMSQEDPPPPSSETHLTPIPDHALPPVTDYASFTKTLEAVGFDARLGHRVKSPLLSGALSHVPWEEVFIDDVKVWALQYPTEASLVSVREGISSDGSVIPVDGGSTIADWSDPHYFSSGKLLVIYMGKAQRTLNALQLVLGPQFAGR